MLAKTSPTKHIKKMRSFHTSVLMRNLDYEMRRITGRISDNNALLSKILEQNTKNNDLLKENNFLLNKIVKQSETGNKLLQGIIKQKQLSLTLEGLTKQHYKNQHYNVYPQLEQLYNDLSIKVETHE
jgi:hypothetical protein